MSLRKIAFALLLGASLYSYGFLNFCTAVQNKSLQVVSQMEQEVEEPKEKVIALPDLHLVQQTLKIFKKIIPAF